MIGVLQFPGSCDERDAVLACERVGEARLVWHGGRDLGDVDAVVIPGGFSYGDYLRAGAIARFSPMMESVIEFAGEGGLVLGICNGFQVLCEAGLLPGALLPNEGLRFVCRQVDLEIVDAGTPFTNSREAGELVLGDEAMTPDSSRFWPADEYEPGRGQRSFDKQYVRDWAAGSGWDKTPPAPAIPDDVVAQTRAKYVEAYERLSDESFDAWLERTSS